MTSTFAEQRRAHLQALSAQLPDRGLVGRTLGGEDPVLWIWHPRTGKQTIVFATPSTDGWLFLWSPGGQEDAANPAQTADLIEKLLSEGDG
ncbi:hypothetical protein HNP84_002852 [Thermocatellispora tengchongensis]|uniref:Uncharacterized protein n=1 Tax=Thermocatellispora tengchongensis TaxID=1073253 RepID=A0A840P5J2_9ACTN|nr:hypothetical protein [Thermocatellispora tengchongensis]MBB5133131.1 hypothetical protein [Thermocatellispora tengchongensis]